MFLSIIYAKGLHFGMLGSIGTIHQGPQKMTNGNDSTGNKQKPIFSAVKGVSQEDTDQDQEKNESQYKSLITKIEDENDTWGHSFDWAFGVYAGYRFDLPKGGFFDWNFFDFSHGLSLFTSMRLGCAITENVSFYMLASPFVFLTNGIYGIAKYEMKKSITPEEFLDGIGYRAPFMGLGISAGIGVNYRLSPKVSLVGQWTMQASYFDLVDAAKPLLDSGKTAGQKAQILLGAFAPDRAQIIRQRISFGVEFNTADRIN